MEAKINIEQSKRLAEILPIESADMEACKQGIGGGNRSIFYLP